MNRKIILCQENLVDIQVDAIVNTTNERLNEKAGISAKIIQRAGGDLAAECARVEGCHTGEAVITKGYLLPASYVIHTVGPRFSVKYQTAAENALHGCYRRCLEVLKENNLESIAFPLINTERKGYPKEPAAHIASRTVRRFLEKYGSTIHTVILCMETAEDLKIYERVLPLYFPRSVQEEQAVASLLPQDVGNDLGESVIQERQIRISAMPGLSADADVPVVDPNVLASRKRYFTANDASVASPHETARKSTDAEKKDFTAVQENPDDIRRKFDQSKSKDQLAKEEAERKYQYFLRKSKEEDLSDLAKYNFIYESGTDTSGRPVVVIVANKVPAATVDLERILLYMIKILDPIVEHDYTVLYCHTNIQSENKPPMKWLSQVYEIFNRKYKKNMKRLYVLHPSFWVKLVMFFVQPFVSKKVWIKIRQVKKVMDLYDELNPQTLQLPEDILKTDQEMNAADYAVQYRNTGDQSQQEQQQQEKL